MSQKTYGDLLEIKKRFAEQGIKPKDVPCYWIEPGLLTESPNGPWPFCGTLASWLRHCKGKPTDYIYILDENLNGGEWLPIRDIEVACGDEGEDEAVWIITDSMIGGGIPDEEFQATK